MSHSFATSWTIECQVPLSMGFPRQEYQSGLSFSSPYVVVEDLIYRIIAKCFDSEENEVWL